MVVDDDTLQSTDISLEQSLNEPAPSTEEPLTDDMSEQV